MNKFEQTPNLQELKNKLIGEVAKMDKEMLEAVRSRLGIQPTSDQEDLKRGIIEHFTNEVTDNADFLAMENIIKASQEHGRFIDVDEREIKETTE